MPSRDVGTREFEIGKFVCPTTKALVPLMGRESLAFLHWPLTVEKCPGCGETHVLNLTDVQHPPLYGYE